MGGISEGTCFCLSGIEEGNFQFQNYFKVQKQTLNEVNFSGGNKLCAMLMPQLDGLLFNRGFAIPVF